MEGGEREHGVGELGRRPEEAGLTPAAGAQEPGFAHLGIFVFVAGNRFPQISTGSCGWMSTGQM